MIVKAHLHYNCINDEYDLWVRSSVIGGRGIGVDAVAAINAALEHKVKTDGVTELVPLVTGRELAVAIMEAVWEYGWRPPGFDDHKNEATALRSHIDDLRQIAFKALDIQK